MSGFDDLNTFGVKGENPPIFDPQTLRNGYHFVILYGKVASGKTVMLKDLMLNIFRSYHSVYLFSGSEDVKRDFLPFIGKKDRVLGGLDDPQSIMTINQLFKSQSSPIAGRCLLLFDDIIALGNSQHNCPYLMKLATNYRHYKITVILATQHMRAIPPTVRANCSHAIIFRQINGDAIKALVQEYLGGLIEMSNREKINFLNEVTSNYSTLVVINNSNIEYRTYKAEFSLPALYKRIMKQN